MLYCVDFIVYLHGKFALCEELVVHYTFMVSSLCVRNWLYKFFRAKRLANLALFSYPCVRNSYVSFGTVQLSICEELIYACSIL